MSNARSFVKRGWLLIILLVVVAAAVQGCSSAPAPAAEKEKPSVVEAVEGSDLKRVLLTEKAAQRIGVETVMVEELIPMTGESKKETLKDGGSAAPSPTKAPMQAVPYAAVIYDTKGDTWLYTNPEPLSFVRQRISVDRIDGEWAVLSENLPANTRIVTVGVAELYGAETGVGK